MRVVQINSVCGVGSTGRVVVDISKALTKNNIENYIFFGVGESDYILSEKIGNKINIRIHQVGTRFLGYHGVYSKAATKKFLVRLDGIKPDIIHIHNIHGFYINIELLFDYIKKNNIKVVWTLHDCWAFTGHCAHFDFDNCNRWESQCFNCPNKKKYPKSLIFDRSKKQFILKEAAFNKVKTLSIVTPSKWLANLVQKSFLKNYPVQIINNGIDLEIFKPTKSDFVKKYNLEGKYIILGIAVNLDKSKGAEYLIKLAEILPEAFKVIILGVAENQIKSLPKNIIGIAKTSNLRELAEIYTAVDVYVNPTLEDSFPTTNLEALACGTPIITFNTGGSVEAVDEKTGIVVGKGNLNELAEAVVSLEKENLKSEDCMERAVLFYNKNKRYNDYLEIYRGI